MKKILFALSLFLIWQTIDAQVITPFAVRKTVSQKGGILFLSNTSSKATPDNVVQNEVPPAGTGYDNNYTNTYVDIDGDSNTFMSSSDSLALSGCSEITWAGLYWGGDCSSGDENYSTRTQVKLKANSGSYIDLTADELKDNTTGFKTYHCFKDITSILKSNGINVRYTVANVATDISGKNLFGGWTIVIIYKNNTQTMRNLTVFDGLANVMSSYPTVDIPVSGFQTPLSGPVTFELGLVVYDGDRSLTGDQLMFKGGTSYVNLSDALHNTTDMFNSTISKGGVLTAYRKPSYNNNLGYDANIFTPDNTSKNYIGNNAISAIIRQTTGGETFLTQVVTSAIDIYEPDLRSAVRVQNITHPGATTAQPGDILEYTVNGLNIGSDPSVNTYVTDTIEGNAEFVPGSLKITYGPNAGTMTDDAGDDQGEYISSTKVVRVRIGTGANSTTGGYVENSPTGIDSTQFKFRVKATDDCVYMACDAVIDNSAHIKGTGNVSGNTFDNESNPGVFDANGCPVVGTTKTPINISGCAAPTASCNSPICLGSTIYFTASYSPSATYAWSGPNSFSSTLREPSKTNVTAADSGTYKAVISITGRTCAFTYTFPAVINVANAGPDQIGSTTCGVTTVTMRGNKPSGTTGLWTIVSGTGGSFANSASPTTTFTGVAGNTYVLRWTLSSSDCPSSSDDVSVKFNSRPASAVLSGSTSICYNNYTSIQAAVSGGTSPYTVKLNNSGGTFTNYTSGSDMMVGPLTATTAFSLVSVTDANGCASASTSGSAVITVSDAISGSGAITQSAGLTTTSTSATAAGAVAASGTNYTWSYTTSLQSSLSSSDTYYVQQKINGNSTPQGLKLTTFGFSIPTAATINGILVKEGRKVSSSSGISIKDKQVQLMNNGSTVGSNLASSTAWSTTESTVSYGGATNTWSRTWTPAEINSSAFGLYIQNTKSGSGGSNPTASINYVSITIYYSLYSYCDNTTAQFAVTSYANATTYTWTPPTGARVSAGQGAASATVDFNGIGLVGTYQVCVTPSNLCQTATSSCVNIQLTDCSNSSLNLMGYVYWDKNGMNDSYVNGTGVGTANGSQLYITQASTSTGKALRPSVSVSSDGFYSIPASSSTSYLLVLSKTSFATGASPTSSLPSGCSFTGEIDNNTTNTSTGNDGKVDGYLISTVLTTNNNNNVNFGIKISTPPVAVNDITTTSEDVSVSYNVTTNDTDADGTVSVSSVDLDPSTSSTQTTITNTYGTWTVNTSGVVTYAPKTNFNGMASVTYTVADNDGNTSSTGTLFVNVSAVNDLPVASASSFTILENYTHTFSSSEFNFSDAESDAMVSITVSSLPSLGTLSLSGVDVTAGQVITAANISNLVYTPVTNGHGSPYTSFLFKVNDSESGTVAASMTIYVTHINVAPVAANDAATTTQGVTSTLNILSNDACADGTLTAGSVDLDPLTSGQQTSLTVYGEGTYSVDGSGNLTFVPLSSFYGTATAINYTVTSSLSLTSNKASVVISVIASGAPIAVSDVATVNENSNVTFNITSNDYDNDGTINVSRVDLDPSTTGIQQSYYVDGKGQFSVDMNGDVSFVPDWNYYGTVSIQYTVRDNQNLTSNAASITVTVNWVNATPFAVDDVVTTNEDTPVTFNALTNDYDLDGSLNVASVDLNPLVSGRQTSRTVSGVGSYTVDSYGNITFTPASNYNGTTNSVGYTVTDNLGMVSDSAVFVITVDAVNDAPVAVADNITAPSNESVVIDILSNDTDVDNSIDVSTIDLNPSYGGIQSAYTVSGQGTYTVGASGTITFVPVSSFVGPVVATTIYYTVNDASGATSNSASITITLTDPSAPVASDDNLTINEDGSSTVIDVLSNDTPGSVDIDVTTVDLDPLTSGQQASVTTTLGTLVADVVSGTVTFTPSANAYGTTSVNYTVTDDNGLTSNVATIYITVNAVNDVPSFTKGANQAVCSNAGVQIVSGWASSISKGASNESGQTLTFWVANNNTSLFSYQPTIDSDGTLYFTPSASGIATVSVALHDDGGTSNGGVSTSASQTFTITVYSLPSAPSASATQTFTGSATVSNLAASTNASSTVYWYTSASGGSVLSSTDVLSNNTTYYAEAENNTTYCSSLSRTAVKVYIYPYVNLSIGNSSISEAGASTTVTAQLSCVFSDDVVVNLSYTGTATNGSDYTAASTTIYIAAGSTSGTVVLTAIDDNVYEGSTAETIVTSISSLVNASNGTTTSVSTSITENDAQPTVDLSINNSSINEAAGTATVTATLNRASTQNITVNLGYTGTATNGSDYTAASTTIYIAAGSTTGTVVLTAIDDNVYEGSIAETIVTSISSLVNASNGTTTSVSTSITENDAQPTVDLSINNSSINEAAGTATVTATLNRASTQNITVNLGYTGTATNGSDYTAASTTIYIAAGSTTGTVVLTAIDDNVYEGSTAETIVTSISSLVNASNGTTTSVSTSITENDAQPTVDLSINNSSINEAAGTATVTATLNRASTQNITLNLGYTGTATNGSDYTAASTTIYIAAGSTTGTVVLTAIDDNVYEGSTAETIVTSISSLVNASNGTTTSVSTSITENDAQPTVDLSINNSSINEAAGTATVTATLNRASTQNITVNLGYTGTATNGSDYTAASTTIYIAAGSTTGTVVLTAIDDNVYEGSTAETIVTSISSLVNASNGTTTSVSTSITENDAQPTVDLSINNSSINEAAGTATVTATLNRASTQNITVNLGYTGTATNGSDYTAASTTIYIAAGSTTGTVVLTAIDDNVYEGSTAETIVTSISSLVNASNGTTTSVSTSITENDAQPTVDLSINNSSINEAAGTATVTATLNRASTQNITVNLGYTGTATNGSDYTAASTTIYIAAGSTSGTVVLTAIDDNVYEGSTAETIVTSISSLVNASNGTTTSVSTSITENDAQPTVDLSINNSSINEAAGTATVTATLNRASTQNITVNLGYTGTATNGSDYTAASTTIYIAAGSTSGTVVLTAIDDNVYEGSTAETIVTSISSLVNASNGTTTSVSTSITENDAQPTVDLSINNSSINEAAGTATVTATLNRASTQNITVNLGYTGTATNGSDYTAASTTIYIAAGSTTGTVVLTAIDDNVYEGSIAETIVTSISSLVNASNGTTTSVSTSITENDAQPTVDLSINNSSINEAAGTATVTATLNRASTQNITVNLGYTGTATNGSDYTAASTTIYIAAGSTTGTVVLTAIDDNVYEGSTAETIVTSISSLVNASNGTTTSVSTSITENDAQPTVDLSINNSSINEAAGTATVTATLNRASTQNITVNLGYTGTATNGSDYTAASTTIYIAAGSTTGTVVLTAIDDNVYEGSTAETIVTSISSLVNASNGTTTSVSTSITENDAQPTVDLSINNSSINEAAGTATVTATLNRASTQNITLNLGYTGTATNGSDYTAASTTIYIAAGSTTGTVVLTAIDDNVYEGSTAETIVTSISSLVNASNGTTTSVSTSITENDAQPTVDLSINNSSINEAAGTATVTATLNRASTQNITVNLGYTGTATNGSDYTAASTTIYIAAGSTTGMVVLTAIDDNVYEGSTAETIVTSISSLVNASNGTTTSVSTSITENDAQPTVDLSINNSSINEAAGTATVTATLNRASTQNITVNLGYTGTATNGSDYTAASTTIYIAAGSTTGTVVLTAIDDNVYEGSTAETIVTSISSLVNASNGTTTSVSTSITENDAQPTVDLSINNSSINEAAGTATVTATLNRASTQNITVNLGYTGTATNGSDYTAASTTIYIAAGSTSGTVVLTAIDDNVYEGSTAETIVTSISSLVNASNGTTTSVSTSITENDAQPTVDLSINNSSINEAAGTATVTATLNRASTQNITVNLGYTGTATNGSDYTAASTTIYIAAGSTSGTVVLTAIDDNVYEGSTAETIVTSISSLVNASNGTTTSVSTSITENDAQPTVDLSINNSSINEAAGTATVTATLNRASTQNITVNLGYTGTATNGSDYTAASTTIYIAAGSTTGTVVLTAIDDNVYEGSIAETIVTSISSLVNASNGTTTSVSTSITENDAQPTVDLSINNSSINEAAGTATVTATLNRASTQNITVNLGYTGTATNGSDYTAASTTIYIAAGSTTGTVVLTAIDDNVYEGSTAETIVTSISSLVNASNGTTTSVSTSITENDAQPTVDLSINNSSINEAAGTATVTATLNRASTQNITLNLGYTGTATNGSDYTAASTTIYIAAGSTTGTVVLTAIDDNVYEGSTAETIVTSISSLVNASNGTTTSVSTSITENDAQPTVDLSINNSSIGEAAGVATVTATLNRASTQNITVNLGYSGTATNGSDYTAASTTIYIAAGSTTGTVVLTAIDDNVYEGSTAETIVTSISSLVNASNGTTTSVSTSITENDAQPTVDLSINNSSINEAAGTATVTATLNRASTQNITVNLGYTGTATNGSDYTAASTTIYIAAGSTTGTVVLTAIDDNVYEGSTAETIVTSISSLVNASNGTTTSVSTSITENDAQQTVDLSVNTLSVNETGSGVATFTATLSNPSTQSVIVNFGISGTSVAADYNLSATSVTIPAGATSANFTATAVDDLLSEGNESLVVDIVSVTNASENGTQQATVTIVDNDVAGITVSAISGNTSELGATATFTVVLNTQPTSNVVISLASNDLTEGTISVSGLSFTSSNWNTPQIVTVTGVDDPNIDGNISYLIVTGAAVSSDLVYNGINPSDVVVVNADNDVAPSIADVVVSVNENSATSTLVYDVNDTNTSNDTDGNGDAIQYSITGGNTLGAFEINSLTGVITVANQSALDFETTPVFHLTVHGTDGTNTDDAAITINLNNVNEVPVAVADNYSVNEGETLTLAAGVLSNDSDVDGNTLTAILVSSVSNGTLSLNLNGSFVYTHNGSETTSDSFTYKVNDGTVDGNTVTVSITVNPVNDAPVAVADSYSVNEGASLTVTAASGVLNNDTDAEGNTLSAILVSTISNGTLSLNTNGSFAYTHNGSETTSDSFTYKVNDGTVDGNTVTVSITVNPVNDAPVAVADSYSVNEGASLTVTAATSVLNNDTDAEGNTLSAILVSTVSYGTLSLNTNGSFTYTHNGSETTSDSFTYKVNDGTVDGNTVTVSITVNPVNDAPVAVADNYSVDEAATLTVTLSGVLANDYDADSNTLTASLLSSTTHGSLTFNTDGTFTYVHDGSESVADGFTYKAFDGAAYSSVASVTITINPINDKPIPVADTIPVVIPKDKPVVVNLCSMYADPEGSSLTITIGCEPSHGTQSFDGCTLTYTPAANYTGSDYICYQVCDNMGACVQHKIYFEIGNNAPVSVADNYSVDEAATLTVTLSGVLANDYDADSNTLTASLVSSTSHGSLTFNTDGTFTYVHDGSESVADGFTYQAFDGAAYSSVASVTITINPINDKPIPVADTIPIAMPKDKPVVVNLCSLYADPEGSSLTITIGCEPSHGTQSFDGCTLTYTPAANYTGSDYICYQVCDNMGACVQHKIYFEIGNNAPVSVADNYSVDEAATLTVTLGGVLANDYDADSNTLTASLVSSTSHGSLTFNTDGTFTYVHDGSETVADEFTYKAFDGAAYSSVASVTITINPINDKPVLVADTIPVAIPKDKPVVVNLCSLYADPEGSTLTITIGCEPSHGTQSFDGCTLTYTPAANYTGSDYICYQVCDNMGACVQHKIYFEIGNNAPVSVADNYSVDEAATLTVTLSGVLANDYDADSNTLTASLVSSTSQGSLTFNTDGTFTYVHDGSESVADGFTYQAFDGAAYSSVASVAITINPINDKPVLVADTIPVAIPKDKPVVVNLCSLYADPEGSSLTITIGCEPSHGTQSFDGCTLTYTPAANYTGSDYICYQVCDNMGACVQHKIYFEIGNNAPVSVADNYSVDEAATLTVTVGGVLANDYDADSNTLTASLVSSTSHGSLTFNTDGTFTYVHDGSESVADGFTYKAFDGAAYSSVASVTITINPINDKPIPVADTIPVVIPKDKPVVVNLCSMYADPEGSSLTITIGCEPSHGTQSFDGCTLTYTPAANYTGSDYICYQVCDNMGACVQHKIYFEIGNNAPVSVADNYSVDEAATLTVTVGGVLANDYDADSNTLTASLVSSTSHGSLTFNTDGTFTYVHDGSESVADGFTYQAFDGAAYSSVASVTITINPINDKPIPVADTIPIAMPKDKPVVVNLCSLYADPEGSSLTITIECEPSHGTQSFDGCTLTYTPAANYTGSDYICYQVCDNMGACVQHKIYFEIGNNAPVSVADNYSVDEAATLTVTLSGVLANDYDADSNTLTASLVSSTSHGSLAFNTDGTFTYVHDGSETVADGFTYQAFDGAAYSSVASVTITINPINDKPVLVADTIPVAIPKDKPVVVNLCSLYADPEGSSLTITIGCEPSHGTQSFDGCTLTYTPAANYTGSDYICYQVCDNMGACVQHKIYFEIGNNAPVSVADNYSVDEAATLTVTVGGVLANDYDADSNTLTASLVSSTSHGSLTFNTDGTFTYVHDGSETVADEFTYKAFDGAAYSSVASVTITINPINDKPVLASETLSITTSKNNSVNVDLCSNASDPENDLLNITISCDPKHGSYLFASCTLTYTPNAEYVGKDSICYTVCDNGTPSKCTTAYVVFDVRGISETPIAIKDEISVNEDNSIIFDPLQNDTGLGNSPISISISTLPAHGLITITASGTLNYTPFSDYAGKDSLVYTICDTDGQCASASIIITVVAVDDVPAAIADRFTISENLSATINITENDLGLGDGSLSLAISSNPKYGTATITASGTISYTPAVNFVGNDTLEYTLCDIDNQCASATIIITVNAGNSIPVCNPDIAILNKDEASTFSVLTNDTNIADAPIVVSIVTQPSHGTATVNTDGTITYTPEADYNGTDRIVYRVCDANGDCASAEITITVNAVNDAPVLAKAIIYSSVISGQALSLDLSGNASDNESNQTSVSIISQPTHGTASISTDGKLIYTSTTGYTGADTVYYQVCDNGTPSQCTIGKVAITVSPAPATNTPPVIANIRKTAYQEVSLNFVETDFTSKYSDAENDNMLKIRIESLPVAGVLSYNNNNVSIGDEIPASELSKLSFLADANTPDSVSFTWSAYDGYAYSVPASVIIRIEASDRFVPEGFSPNGDGVNDYFYIKGADKYIIHLQIFNRWGNLVYESKHYQNNWSGTSNRGLSLYKDLIDGTYYYIIDFQNGENRKVGFITINR